MQFGPTITAAVSARGTVVGEPGTSLAGASEAVVGEAGVGSAAVTHLSCQRNGMQFCLNIGRAGRRIQRAPYPASLKSRGIGRVGGAQVEPECASLFLMGPQRVEPGRAHPEPAHYRNSRLRVHMAYAAMTWLQPPNRPQVSHLLDKHSLNLSF